MEKKSFIDSMKVVKFCSKPYEKPQA